MNAQSPLAPDTAARSDRTPPRLRWPILALGAAGLILVISIVRALTGAGDLTSSGTASAAVRAAVPIGLAGLGGLYAERTGVVNIGLEGMMILGTWFGGWAGFEFGAWWGALAGVLGGATGGLLHAVATVGFGVDHIVSGVGINILGAGAARFLSVTVYENVPGGGAVQSPPVQGDVGELSLPLLAGGDLFGWSSPNLFGWLERQDWFLVSDVGGILRGATASLSWLTVIAILLVPLTWWFLWRTPLGLRMRSVGEHPAAAETLGVDVYRMKYVGVTLSGALAGLAGAFLVIEAAGIYREGQTGGRGFIGLAAMIFGNWRPGGTAAGAGLFGFADALQLRSGTAVHAVLLFLGIALLALAVVYVVRRRVRLSAVVAVVGGAALMWFLTSDAVPREFVFFFPHVLTLLVLAFASQRLRMPAADGQRYRRGEAG